LLVSDRALAEISLGLKKQLEENERLKKDGPVRVSPSNADEIERLRQDSQARLRQAEERRAKTEEELKQKIASLEKRLTGAPDAKAEEPSDSAYKSQLESKQKELDRLKSYAPLADTVKAQYEAELEKAKKEREEAA